MPHLSELAVRIPIGLLPVLSFLAALLYLDSYKLTALRTVLCLIVIGGLIAGASYLANRLALDALAVPFVAYSRYVAPILEELLKGLAIVYLIRANRIGFLVDAAIAGFAIGAGFALIENLYYLQHRPEAQIGVWIVRGFGTAIMHGGATALFALMAQAFTERGLDLRLKSFLPGLAVAIMLHSLFNHFFFSPILSTLGVLLVLPPLMVLVFRKSAEAVASWLQVGFDADTELLELIDSGRLAQSRVGEYLDDIKHRFRGPVIADLLCYLRLHTELALRAKGMLMMREIGFQPGDDAEVREKFRELRFLEGSIGTTGRLALQPFLHVSRKDLWQLKLLQR
ncbi:MAG: PrsW family glutamic-type intramembrane protease [Gammaproteobacteria bacterium]